MKLGEKRHRSRDIVHLTVGVTVLQGVLHANGRIFKFDITSSRQPEEEMREEDLE